MKRSVHSLTLAIGFAVIALFLPTTAPAAETFGPLGQVSSAGPPGDLAWRAAFSDIAASNRFEGSNLIVWIQDTAADRSTAAVFGRMYDPVTGAPRTDPFQISESGPHNSLVHDYDPPAVTYNSVADEFLVAWNDATDASIFVRRVSAAGAPLGADIAIGGGYSNIETVAPVFSPEANQYIVAWKATFGGSQQVWAQRLNGADGAEVGVDIQVSQMSANANDAVSAAYSPALQRYLIVWRGQTAPIATEYEVYGQLLGLDGVEVGTNDFRISDMGPDGDGAYRVTPPEVEWNPVQNEWLAAWTGDDNAASVDNEYEVFAQRLAGDGTQVGTNDFRVTNHGPANDPQFATRGPRVAVNPVTGEYLMTYHASVIPETTADQFEVFVQRLTAGGDLVNGATQVTDVIPVGINEEGAVRPAIVYSPRTCNFNLSFTQGDEYPDSPPTPETAEVEIFQRSVVATSCTRIPCPAGTSATVVCSPDSDGNGIRYLGTAVAEVFVGTIDGDTMSGGLGNDVMNGEAGKDVIKGDSGNDKLDGGTGNDKLKGGNGKDRLRGRSGADRIEGGRHNDKLYGYSGNDKLYGQSGNDLLSGGTGRDKLFGATGRDRLNGGASKDWLRCGAGRDRFTRSRVDRIAADCRP